MKRARKTATPSSIDEKLSIATVEQQSSFLTIAVDIGNSAIKLAWREADSLVPTDLPAISDLSDMGPTHGLQIRKFSLVSNDWQSDLANVRRSYLATGNNASGHRHACRWVIASVNSPGMLQVKQLLAHSFPMDSWHEITHRDVPLEIDVRSPDRLGIDRLLGGWQASLSTGKSTVISVDAGSAVTVDLVRDGRFVGGAIMPGIRLQFAALRQGTDRLPAIEMGPDVSASHVCREIPGLDTESAMRAGVILGIAGGIERLVKEYSSKCSVTPSIVFTGGDVASLAPLLPFAVEQNPTLVLQAIMRIAGSLRVE